MRLAAADVQYQHRGAGRVACSQMPRWVCDVQLHTAPLNTFKSECGSLTHFHTNTHKQVHAVGRSTQRQKAQTWNSKVRWKLFTYAVTILEICIKKEVWNSLIERVGGGVMHL